MKKHGHRTNMRKSHHKRTGKGFMTKFLTKQGAIDKIIANITAPNIYGTDDDGDLHPDDARDKRRRDAENAKLMEEKGITDDDIQKEMRKRAEQRDREREEQERDDYDRGTYGGKRRKSRKSRKSRKMKRR